MTLEIIFAWGMDLLRPIVTISAREQQTQVARGKHSVCLFFEVWIFDR
jgi:hypothetical protein